MKVKQWFSFCALLCSILLLSACGSNSGSGGDKTAPPAAGDKGSDAAGIKYAGTDKCIGCHKDFSWSTEIVDAYLMGKHVIHSDHITAANKVEGCLVCHDPYDDGPALEALIPSANVPTEGLAAIGCEACHGAGGDHYGVGPMPIARPEAAACATCHDELPGDHLIHHTEGNMIATDYATSAHSEASGRNEAICVKCHNDEGAQKYKDVVTWEALANTVPIEGTTHAIQCRTCHDPHHAGTLLKPSEDSGYPKHELTKTTEYATCTNCHQAADAQLVSIYDENGNMKSFAAWEAEMNALRGISADMAMGDLIYHASRFERVISSTHFDNPLTTDKIEGYVVDPTNEKACRSCHNVHSGNLDINKQWAKSRHAGQILTRKQEANANNHVMDGAVDIRMAGVPDTSSWPHYDWDAGDRQGCQKCHTSTGFANFATNPAAYDQTNNDFSHLEGWAKDGDGNVTSSGQNELLYCWSCHSDNAGALRNTGAITVDYTVDGVNPILADISGSNVCVTCHLGQGNMDKLIDNAAADPAKDISGLKPGFGSGTKNVTVTHYLAAAGTIYQAQTRIGYEYPGQSYADPVFFGHGDIDVDGAGPCVACHMETDEPHAWKIVTKDDTGTITALNSTSCIECHSGDHGAALAVGDAAAAALLQEEAEGFNEALEILEQALIAKGLTFTGGYPYFSGSSWVNEGNLGAAHNFNYLHHEPGAYAHNRFYAKRLIFDSIDWVNNYTMDGSIAFDPAAYPAAAAWFNAEGGIATRP